MRECPSGRCWGTRGALALVPTPIPGQSEVFAQRKFGSFLHPNIQVEQKGQVSVLAGAGPISPAEPGVSGQGLPRAGPLATPALAVGRVQPQGCGQEDALLAPLGHVPPSTSHPNSMLESQQINAPGRKKTDRRLDCKALCPAQHRSLGYNINRESSVPASPRSTRTKGLCTSLG